MSATTDKLSILIEVLTGQAEATLGRFEKVATKAFGGADSAANKMRVSLNQRLSGGIEGLTQKVPAAKAGLDALGLSAETAASALTTGLGVGAGAAIAKGVETSIKSFVDLGSQILQFSRVTKMSAEESSRWTFVLNDMGIAQDKAAISIGRLERNLASNVKLLDQWGITAVRGKDGLVDMDATLMKVADTFAGMQNADQQAALGVAAFGKSWQTLLPVLSQGSAGIKELKAEVPAGGILSTDDLQTALQLKTAFKQLGDEAKSLELTIGKDLAPALVVVADDVKTLAHEGDRALGPIGGLGKALGYIAGHTPVTGALHAVASALDSSSSAADRAQGFFTGIVPPLSLIWHHSKTAANNLTDQKKATDELGDATKQATPKLFSFANAIDGIQKKIETGVADVAKNAAKMATDITSAQDSLTSAQHDAASASQDYGRAEKDLTDVQANRLSLLDNEQKATLKVADAVTNLQRVKDDAARSEAEAQRSVIRAQDAVNRAAEKGDIEGYADAQLQLADAQDRQASTQQNDAKSIHDATNQIGEANQAVVDARKAYVDSAQAVQDAEQKVKDALQGASDKALALAKAVQAFDDAQAGGSADTVKSIGDQRTALEQLAATYSIQFGPDSAPVKYIQGMIALLDQAKVAAQGANSFFSALPGDAGGQQTVWGGRAATDYAPAPGMPGYNPAAGGTSVSSRMFTGALPPTIVQHIYGISADVAFQEAAAKIRPAVSMSNVR